MIAFHARQRRKIRDAKDVLCTLEVFGRIRSPQVTRMMREVAAHSTAGRARAEAWLAARD